MHKSKDVNWFFNAPGEAKRIEANFKDFAFSPHRHDTYAIGITLEGVQSFDYRGQNQNSLPGNVVVLHPDEKHDGRAGTEDGFRYRTIYIQPFEIQNVLQGQSLPFVKGGISTDKKLHRATSALLNDFQQPLNALEYEDAIFDMATALAEVSGVKHKCNTINYRATNQIRSYLDEKWNTDVSLEDLELICGYDRWKLSRDFRSLFGTSPYRYIVMRRLHKAQRQILSGKALSDVAFECGFSDQSHLTRQFKKTFGLTPKRWKAITSLMV